MNDSTISNMTADEAGTWILEHTPSCFQVRRSGIPLYNLSFLMKTCQPQKMMATNYSFGIERDEKVLKRNDGDYTKWTNPLEHRYVRLYTFSMLLGRFDDVSFRLPNAPSMKFYCVYGHGKETEVSLSFSLIKKYRRLT